MLEVIRRNCALSGKSEFTIVTSAFGDFSFISVQSIAASARAVMAGEFGEIN